MKGIWGVVHVLADKSVFTRNTAATIKIPSINEFVLQYSQLGQFSCGFCQDDDIPHVSKTFVARNCC